MFDFGWAEILIIGAIALFVIGPQDIPKIAYQVGKFFRRIKYMQYALTGQFDDFMAKAEGKQAPKTEKEELDHDPMDEAEADAELLEMMPLPESQSLYGDEILEVDYTDDMHGDYRKHFADCVVLSKDNKLVIQKRTPDCPSNPNGFNIFGGHIEKGETVLQGLKREIEEELGLILDDKKIIKIGSVTEGATCHKDIAHVHFYHDVDGGITGCYGGEMVEFDNYDSAFTQEKLMPYAKWALAQCKERGLIE